MSPQVQPKNLSQTRSIEVCDLLENDDEYWIDGCTLGDYHFAIIQGFLRISQPKLPNLSSPKSTK